MKKFIPAYLVIALLSFRVAAQDIHFSEFYNAPLQLNPAYTGFFDGDYRFTAIYRNQWDAITTPYSTLEGSADFRILTGADEDNKNILGFGIDASSDKAGDSQFSTNEITLSSAFSLATGYNKTNYLSGGFSAGIGDASIDYSNLVFDQQYFEPNMPTTETLGDNSYKYIDLSGGMAWHYIPNKFTNFNIGAAVFHINQPQEAFFGNDATSILYRKYVIDASAQFSLTNTMDLYPKGMFDLQGPYSELDLGSLLRFNLSPGYIKNEGFYLGAFYRYGDAIILTTRLDINEFSFAFSYDITVSHLAIDGEGQGGPELSLIYIGKTSNKHTVYCPRF
jgi:type IX secretion system PorP/SprF family membrane protein